MKAKELIKKWSSVALVCALAFPILALTDSFAASPIDTDRECSITVQIEKNEPGGIYDKDLKEVEIPVHLYKVAEVDETGAYEELKGYESLELDKINDKTTADEWLEKAKKAEKLSEKKNPDAELAVKGGKAKKAGLSTGMYLVDAEPTYSKDYAYQYKFSPYLIALPDNLYYESGNDDWVYDVEVGLKPEREQLYGKLEIIKTLKEFNASLGEASFVFDIKAYDRDDDSLVYSNVVSTRHSAAGKVTAVVERIPAGARVVVTEVYSGSSYEIEGLDTKETVIVSDIGVEQGGQSASVDFTNVYNEETIPGYGVTNHFEYGDDGWTWEQQDDNSAKNE